MDGEHTIERSAEITEAVLHEVFHALHRHRVVLEHILLKPSMVLAGSQHAPQSTTSDIAAYTVRVLKRTVPSAVPGIVFLSGGQSPEEATANLDAMNRLAPLPWNLSFSYGRALQEPPLQAWKGQASNVAQAQQVLLKRARLNSAAALGQYEAVQEKG
jgi:fructose-bisphosphate aldolase class I